MSPTFRFGLLADIQYADKDNGSFEGRARRHREVPAKLKEAVDTLLKAHVNPGGPASHPLKGDNNGVQEDRNNTVALEAAASSPGSPSSTSPRYGSSNSSVLESSGRGGLVAVVGLGDLIDGYPGHPNDRELSLHDLDIVLSQLSRLEAQGVPLRHTFGNHDLSVPREELAVALGLPQGSTGYYSVPLAEGWRLLVLDTTDVSVYGHRQGSSRALEAQRWLEELSSSGAPNALDWNSGVGPQQLQWLRAELADAAAEGERVVAACHHPLVSGSAPDHYLAWNANEIREAFDAHPGVVQLVLTGHFHAGGAACVNGTHYVTLEGMVEAPEGSNSYAVVEVSGTEIVITAGGYASARRLPLRR